MATRAQTYILKKFDGGGYVCWFYGYDKLKLVVKRDMVVVGSLWGLPRLADIELDAAQRARRATGRVHVFLVNMSEMSKIF